LGQILGSIHQILIERVERDQREREREGESERDFGPMHVEKHS